jgi:hypothetical protein
MADTARTRTHVAGWHGQASLATVQLGAWPWARLATEPPHGQADDSRLSEACLAVPPGPRSCSAHGQIGCQVAAMLSTGPATTPAPIPQKKTFARTQRHHRGRRTRRPARTACGTKHRDCLAGWHRRSLAAERASQSHPPERKLTKPPVPLLSDEKGDQSAGSRSATGALRALEEPLLFRHPCRSTLTLSQRAKSQNRCKRSLPAALTGRKAQQEAKTSRCAHFRVPE